MLRNISEERRSLLSYLVIYFTFVSEVLFLTDGPLMVQYHPLSLLTAHCNSPVFNCHSVWPIQPSNVPNTKFYVHFQFFFWEGPRSRSHGRTAALRLIVQPCDEDDRFVFSFFRAMGHRLNEIDRGKPKYSGKKPVPVLLCQPQIPYRLTRDRTRACAVTGRRLTAWAVARPDSPSSQLASCHLC
jgi:hypothetical protein